MTDGKSKASGVLRFLASGGWADHDPDVVAGLLEQSRALATRVTADTGSARELRAMARDFLERVEADTLE